MAASSFSLAVTGVFSGDGHPIDFQTNFGTDNISDLDTSEPVYLSLRLTYADGTSAPILYIIPEGGTDYMTEGPQGTWSTILSNEVNYFFADTPEGLAIRSQYAGGYENLTQDIILTGLTFTYKTLSGETRVVTAPAYTYIKGTL